MSDGDVRDPNTGRYVKKYLSSEEARTMQAKKHEKSVETKRTDYEILLREAGYDNPDDAPKVLQVVVNDIIAQGSRTMPAVVQYRQLTGKRDAASQPGRPSPGSVCPLCNELVMSDFRPSDGHLDAAMDLISDNGDNPIT